MTGPNVPDLTAAAGRLDARDFRAALGCFATGVMVIAKRVSLDHRRLAEHFARRGAHSGDHPDGSCTCACDLKPLRRWRSRQVCHEAAVCNVTMTSTSPTKGHCSRFGSGVWR
jgi:hypothetical protein